MNSSLLGMNSSCLSTNSRQNKILGRPTSRVTHKSEWNHSDIHAMIESIVNAMIDQGKKKGLSSICAEYVSVL